MLIQDKNVAVRRSSERGHADQGWLNSRHSFSFANYYDPAHMGFRTLRVINEDTLKGGTGFAAHPHSDMEIVSYVISGGLEHTDSMGRKAVILPDEVQVMSAGTGITHGERNHFNNQEAHFLQIWIVPEKKGLRPGYGQKSFKQELARHKLILAVSREKRNGSIGIHQDVDIHIGRLKPGDETTFKIGEGRHIWVQMIKGSLWVNKLNIKAGDGLSVGQEKSLTISAEENSEFMLFDLN
jgi:redox-sensitive bicupin YhaK (pirin superfamily)